MRVDSRLSPVEAYAAMRTALEAEGVQITHAVPPLLQGHVVATKRGIIRTHELSVTVDSAGTGSVVTVNGHADGYLVGRRAAKKLG